MSFEKSSLGKSICLSILATSCVARGGVYTKADNTNALDQASSWIGSVVPGAGDIARWSDAYSASTVTNSLTAGLPAGPVAWQGINVGTLKGTGLTTNTFAAAVTNITAASETVVNGFNLVTITTMANHGFEPGQAVTIAGVTPSGYNGTYTVAGVPAATQFTYTNAAGSLVAGSVFGTVSSAIYVGGVNIPLAGGTLSIGSSGVDVSAANVSVVINSANISFNSNQQWKVAPGTVLRFANGGVTGASAKALNSGNDGLIEISGGGIVSLNQGGGSGLSDPNSFSPFSGSWLVDSGTTLRGLRSGATAWGTGTITLNGGTLAVGGMSGDVGNWSWTNPIILSPGTTSYIAEQNVAGSGRSLNLGNVISGAGNLVFSEPLPAGTAFTSMDGAFVLCGDESGLAGGTIVIGGPTENNAPGRLTFLRVGGATPTGSALVGAGINGSLGADSVVNNGVLTFSRTDTYVVSNTISGTGSVRIGGTLAGTENQNVIFVGAKTYSGNTTINRGTLTLGAGATIASSPNIFLIPPAGYSATLDASASGFTLASGQTMIGAATGSQLINGNVTAAKNSAIVLGGSNTVGTLTINGNLSLGGGGTLYFDIGTPSDLIQVNGSLNATGVTLIQATNAASLSEGIYPLINVSGALNGNASNFAVAGLVGTAFGQSFSIIYTNGAVALAVGSNPPDIAYNYNTTSNLMTLSWPEGQLGWVLQGQTNSRNVGLSTNWFDVLDSGSMSNLSITINPSNDTVFYRLRSRARLAFQEDWSSGTIDPSKWYMLRKQWGAGNNGVTPNNVWIGTDTVNGTQQNVLICEAHGDQYQGSVTGYGGQKTRVGGVIVTKQFFASGRYEVVMKVGAPAGLSAPIGTVPAIWNYSYLWVQTSVANQANFDPSVPMYNPNLKVSGSPATEYWSEIDYPELGSAGDFTHGGYNVYCQNQYDWKTYSVPAIMDGRYHTYVMEWRTTLKPLTGVKDSQVIEYNGVWWVQDKTIPISSYLGNPLKRLGKDQYSVYAGLTTQNWVDGKIIGGNTNYVPCMASQLTMGVWLPNWGGSAPWQTAQVSFGPVRIWQYDDPGDVRGVLTEDVPPNF